MDMNPTESMVVAAQAAPVAASAAPVAAPEAPVVAAPAPAPAASKKRKAPEDDGLRRGLETFDGIWDLMYDVDNDDLSPKDFPWKLNDLLFSVAGLRAEPKRDPIWEKVSKMQVALQEIQEAGDDLKAIKKIIDDVDSHLIRPASSRFDAKAKKAKA
jgi:transposase